MDYPSHLSQSVIEDLRRSGIDHHILDIPPEDLYAPFSTFRHETAKDFFTTKTHKPFCPLYNYKLNTFKITDEMGMFIKFLHLEHYYRFRNFDQNFTEKPSKNKEPEIVKYKTLYGEYANLFLHPNDHARMLQRDKTLSCFWIEGEKKAWLLYWLNTINNQPQNAIIGSQGVSNFIGSPQWSQYKLLRQAHYLLFDSDSLQKEQVAREEIRLAMALVCAGNDPASIYSIRWHPNSGKGYDDYIVNAETLSQKVMLQRHQDLFKGKPLNVFYKYAEDETDFWWGLTRIAKYNLEPSVIQLNRLGKFLQKKLNIGITEFKQEFARQYRKTLESIHQERKDEDKLTTENGKVVVFIGTQSDIKQHYIDIPALSKQAWHAIENLNTPPEYFNYYSNPIYLKEEGHSGLSIKLLTEKSLKATSYQFIQWKVADKNGMHTREALPQIVEHMLHDPATTCPLPKLQRLTRFPYFSSSTHRLISIPGYHPEDQIFAAFQPLNFTLPATITKDQAMQAKAYIEQHLFVDFPFDHPGDKAHAFCLLFEPYLRSWVDTSPFYSIEAASSGHGKSKLVDCIFMIAFGEKPAHINEQNDQDWGKLIASSLLSKPTLMFFDNLKHTIKSGILANVLTSAVITDRILQTADTPTLINHATWCMTANHPTRDQDIAERTVRIQLCYEDGPNPNLRTADQFVHYPLEPWIMANRSTLLKMILSMIQYWIQEGMPRSQHTHHRFVEWGYLLGGLLQTLDIPSFLDVRVYGGKTERNTTQPIKAKPTTAYVPHHVPKAISLDAETAFAQQQQNTFGQIF